MSSSRVAGNLIDILAREIYPATVVVRDGIISAVEREPDAQYDTYLAPGFVDAHVHVESSMLPPTEFSRLATPHGTVATVSDPHEIANVLGEEGVAWMLADAEHAPLKILFGAPSCVPATAFDSAGATLDATAVARMLAQPRIGYLSEVMNYPGVIAGDPDMLAKIAAAKAVGKPVDGHAPGVRGRDLQKYVAAGISTDHECVALDEAREKIAAGMKILIREGSAAKNFDSLQPLLTESPAACLLCSDDKHPNDLIVGHIDALVRRALAAGAELFDVWRAASQQAIEHYRLNVGLLRPGDPADFIEVDSVTAPRVLRTWIDGRLVAERGRALVERRIVQPINRFAATAKSANEFVIRVEAPQARVIEALDGQLITNELILPVAAENGVVVPDFARDVLKIAVIDRYRNTPPAVALIKNFGLKRGAIASSVSHDSHNIVAVGASDEALARAVNAVIAAGGGLSVAGDHDTHVLPLAIAGLMSDQPGAEVAAEYARLDALAKALGSTLAAPFMTLSFMALLVIPALKLGPAGLFDVTAFQPTKLWVG